MDLSENRSAHAHSIQSVTQGACRIANHTYQQSIIIPSAADIQTCELQTVEDLTESLIEQLCDYAPELIILATGEQIVFPDTALLTPLIKQNIGLEVLSNHAAARTFNVLLAEDRKVVCLMIIKS